jgi:glycerol-3-phosphate acyltransferase PlsY
MEETLAVLFAYLLGSVPFAFLIARRQGVDLRQTGSRNVGATNVLRATGTSDAVTAMSLDALKGAAAVIVAQRLASGPATPVMAAVAAVLGHVYPVWLRFRGGKGVATAAGAFAVLAPVAAAAASGVFLAIAWFTRYVSLGSLAGAATLVIGAFASDVPGVVAAGACVAAGIIVHRHRGNLARLWAGTERRVGQRAS